MTLKAFGLEVVNRNFDVDLPNSSSNEKREYIGQEERVKHLFGEEAVLANLGRPYAVRFPSAHAQLVLQLPVPGKERTKTKREQNIHSIYYIL